MNNRINEDEVISDLFKSFNQDNVILFVGSSAIDNGELTEKICNLPWSCVITTSKKDGFGVEFANRRTPHRYISFSDLPINLFSRDNLPVIQLYGSENEVPAELEEVEDYLRPSFVKKQAEKILNRVMSRMDIRTRMVVIGYNSNRADEIPVETFIFSWQELRGGTIEFFNSDDNPSEMLKKSADKNRFIWYDGKLADALVDFSEEYNVQETISDDDVNLFYKGQQPVFIKKSILSRCRYFAQLLTEEKVHEIRPLGRIQQSRWFYNFLNNSGDSPQWYGFLPQSTFYLKRNYEDVLIAIVKNLIFNKSMAKSGCNIPIILEGIPGSSKSVELAALAYKIYNEKINPVIYINGDNLCFASQSSEIQVLDELMQEIEQVGDKDTRFLIVWDSSSYRNVVAEAKQLVHELENRGRRFVLVCSAYTSVESKKKEANKVYYTLQHDGSFVKSEVESDLYSHNNCYFVSATRELDESEINTLKQKAKLYAVADKEEINKIWDELSGNVDIFEYFYRLIILIRPKLEAGLSREQRLVNRYIRKQLSLLGKKEDEVYNPLFEALKKAGIPLNEEAQKTLEDDEVDVYDLDKFNICIAMFSRFKLDTPYSLALRMLCKNENDFFGKSGVYNDYELFRLLTSQINYIHYFEQIDGKYVFRFRSTLEAEIFLKNNQVSEDKQIEIILEIINHYVECYRKNNEVDYELKESIQSILKMYGPNTEYIEFWKGHKDYGQHLSILRKVDVIADKIHEVRTKFHIPDEDRGFALIEISFYRELYGNMWDKLHNYSKSQYGNRSPWEIFPDDYTEETYKKRLKMLSEVSDLALDSIEKLEVMMHDTHGYLSQRSIQSSINSLTVELAMSNGTLESIKQEYVQYMNGSIVAMDVKPLSYVQLYPILFKAISASPLNGYLYNALFKIFEKEYESASEERRLFLLSDVRMIADDASTLEITNRGMNDKDELSIHLHKIAQYSCSYEVHIADIENGTAPAPFLNLFNNMLSRNNASGICFVCQQELDSIGLSGSAIAEYENETGKEFVLNENQLDVCKSIVDFINNTEYSACVEKSIQALYLLLRVEWMLYNGRPLSIGREWQKTYLKESDWLKVYATCEKYESISGNSVRPIVTLIFALAKIHINRDYLGAAKTMYKVSDMPNQRMRVPYLICFEPGIAQKYNGTVASTHNYSGFLKVDGLPRFAEQNQGVKFYMKNLGLRRMPQKNQILKNFELGLSFASQFSAHKTVEGGEKHE